MKPDWQIHRIYTTGEGFQLQRDMVEELTTLGATWFSLNLFPEISTIAVRGWKIRPKIDDEEPELTIEDVTGFGTS